MILHKHTCYTHMVNGPPCQCEDPGATIACKFCLKEPQPMILKQELDMRADTHMDILRYHGDPGSGQRGGIEVRIRSGAIEDWMREVSKPRARENPSESVRTFVKSPELYVPLEPGIYTRGWGDGNGISHGGGFYHPMFEPSDELITLEGRVNMSFLRAVGLTDGAIFRIEGVYSVDTGITYAQVLPKMLDRFYCQMLKSFSVQIHVQPGRNDALAAK